LAQAYPEIKIVEKHMGSFNLPHDQQIAEETLRAHSDLSAIVALTSASTQGAYSALGRTHQHRATKLIGFDDPDSLPFLDQGKLDSMIIQDTRNMGLQAVRTIATQLQGQPVAREVKVTPVIVTLENVRSPEIRQMLSMEWRPQS
jgi:ribose transport system substrate-binding protein